MIESLWSVVETAQAVVQEAVAPDSIVVDATCGNGHDSLFLSGLLDKKGFLYAFDLQESAVKNTQEKLKGQECGLEVRQANHRDLLELIPQAYRGSISAVMYNLGYLPGSDKKVMTAGEDTLKSIQAAVSLLKNGGVITVVFYPHPEGQEEWKKIKDYLFTLTGPYNAYEIKRLNRSNPPFLVIITKDK